MKQKVEIDTQSITNLGNKIALSGQNMISMIDELLLKANDINLFFDTPSGKVFQRELIEYLNKQKNIIKTEYLDYEVKIKNIVNLYTSVNQEIRNSVGDK